MNNIAEFSVKTFNSGEREVKLLNKLDIEYPVIVNFNWFQEKDIMVLFFMLDCIQRSYGNDRVSIELKINYFPYLRQERLFEAGGCIPLSVIEKMLIAARQNFKQFTLTVMANHSGITPMHWFTKRLKTRLDITNKDVIAIFPDQNAMKHYIIDKGSNIEDNNFRIFTKVRDEQGVRLAVDDELNNAWESEDGDHEYMIYDDLCDGGRTFVECAKILKNEYCAGSIELTVYHAFMTHGLDDLKAAGIEKIHIINPESYDYCCSKYPEDKDYFVLSNKELKNALTILYKDKIHV